MLCTVFEITELGYNLIMNNAELLKEGRDHLLKLHKLLLDHERAMFEVINGPTTPGQFLSLLLDDRDFAWLRRFSTLIVDIDEMFAQKDGYSPELVEIHIEKLRSLILMEGEDEEFKSKYQAALQKDIEAASRHGDLRSLLFK